MGEEGAPVARVLPAGTIAVGTGLLVSGSCAYAFLAVASHELSPQQYGSLSALWSMMFMLWPACFTVVERQAAKEYSAPHSVDATFSPLRQIARFCTWELAVGLVGLLAAGDYLTHRLFNGDGWLLADLALAGPVIALQYVTWGILAGRRRFGRYALVGAAEGTTRLLLAGIIVLVGGARSASWLGIAMALAPFLAVLVALPAIGRMDLHTAPSRTDSTGRMLWLLGSFACLAVLINIGPVLVRVIAPHAPPLETGRFLSALVLVRVPLYLYNAASAALMPDLAVRASRHDWPGFRSSLARLVALVIGLAAVSVPLAALIGPSVLRLVFGNTYVLGGGSLALLAATTCLLVLASTFSVALTATEEVRLMFASWAAGLVALAAGCLLPMPVVPKVEVALFMGSIVPVAAMAAVLYTGRAGRRSLPPLEGGFDLC